MYAIRSYYGSDIVFQHFYDIGIAVGGEKGLVVPILRDVDRLSFAAVEETIRDFVAKIGANRLDLADLEGGTFSITNGGVYGSLLSTPILNPPQSAILGMHAIHVITSYSIHYTKLYDRNLRTARVRSTQPTAPDAMRCLSVWPLTIPPMA